MDDDGITEGEAEAAGEPPAAGEPTAAHALFSEELNGPTTPAEELTAAHQTFAVPTVDATGEAGADSGDGDEEDEEDERKGVSFATKALVVGAAWILLVLFLIGQFKTDDDPGPGPIGLDQTGESATAGEDGDDGTSAEEAAEEPVDVDGDGEIEPGEPGFTTAGTVAGAASGSGGSSGGATGGSGTGGEDGSSGGDATPVTGPGGGTVATSTTTTSRGGGASTTTTSSKPGTSTTTTAQPTTTSAGTPAPLVIDVDRDGGNPEFSSLNESIVAGRSIRFVNKDGGTAHTLRIRKDGSTVATVVLIPSGDASYQFTATGEYEVDCTTNGHDKDALTVTVN